MCVCVPYVCVCAMCVCHVCVGHMCVCHAGVCNACDMTHSYRDQTKCSCAEIQGFIAERKGSIYWGYTERSKGSFEGKKDSPINVSCHTHTTMSHVTDSWSCHKAHTTNYRAQQPKSRVYSIFGSCAEMCGVLRKNRALLRKYGALLRKQGSLWRKYGAF